MIAVIFEVTPKAERQQEYLDIAAGLRPLLETIDGFISIERFQSLTTREDPVAVILARRSGGQDVAHSGAASQRAGEGAQRDFRGVQAADRRGDPRLWDE